MLGSHETIAKNVKGFYLIIFPFCLHLHKYFYHNPKRNEFLSYFELFISLHFVNIRIIEKFKFETIRMFQLNLKLLSEILLLFL